MARQDKQGTTYYDGAEAMQRLGIRSRQTLTGLVKRHQLPRFLFYPDRKVYYLSKDIDYLLLEEAEDPVELPPLTKTGYRPERGPIDQVMSDDQRPTFKLPTLKK